MEPLCEHSTDARLLPRARQGDEQAFTELFHLHYDAIRAFAARMLLNLAEGEELAQEAFIRAARGLGSLRDDASFRAWIFRIAANLCRDALRRRAVQAKKLAELAREREAAERGEPAALGDEVWTALAALDERERAAVVLVYYESLSHAEAARILGCSEATVSWRIHCAKKRLRKLLRP